MTKYFLHSKTFFLIYLEAKRNFVNSLFCLYLPTFQDTTSRPADRMKKLPSETADSIRLRNLKRFVRTCGLHKNYVKLFSECDTMTQREKTLERVLREDTGFQGKKYNLSPHIHVMYYPGLLIFRAVAELQISSKIREIHKNTQNPAKFARNLTKYMSAQHI